MHFCTCSIFSSLLMPFFASHCFFFVSFNAIAVDVAASALPRCEHKIHKTAEAARREEKKNNNLKMISNRLKQKEATALCCVLGSWALAVFIQNKHLRRFSIQQDVGRRRRCWWRRNDYSLFMKYSLSLAQSPNWMCCTCLRVQNSPENPSIVCFFLSLLMPRRRLPACRCIHFTWISFVCCAICFGADWIAPFWQRDGRMRALANPSNEDGKTTRYY